jgi:DNA-binding transcriptional MocR family regulator
VASTVLSASELARLLGGWTAGGTGLAADLTEALTGLLHAGLVPPGAALPPQRGLAAALLVSRGTVSSAYDALAAAGYLTTSRGSGSTVRAAHHWVHRELGGRLLSFTNTPPDVVDLSTGALPASPVTREVLAQSSEERVSAYLLTDGYFPAGLPALRQAIADRFTADGTPTGPEQILVTSGAQEATWLVVNGSTGPGDLVLTEEPTYRGALEAIKAAGAQVQGLGLVSGGLDPEQVQRAAGRSTALLYCQTGIHNPTGATTTHAARRELADVVNARGLSTVEDVCSADLTLDGPPVARTLAGLVEPELLISIGSASKLFWGGLRIGWIRATEDRIRGLVELRKLVDLASSVLDQTVAVDLVRRSDTAREQRRSMLVSALAATEAALTDTCPTWRWSPIAGGSGLWVDTGVDATALTERGKRLGVKLAAGPGFSAYGGQRTFLRLPVWHDEGRVRTALAAVTGGSHPRSP